ncbi:four helix bundle protein [Nostoc sp. CHAB 5844]|nr:four helix bundle protein [Nostoc sp. CHAB 5844]
MEQEKQSSWDIRERSFEYALRAIKLYQFLQEGKDQAGWIIGKQYIRSATSIGANLEEAKSGESKADFIHKYSIAQKEARESLYWLRILNKSEIVSSQRLLPLINETEEIISIITTIIIRVKKNKSS